MDRGRNREEYLIACPIRAGRIWLRVFRRSDSWKTTLERSLIGSGRHRYRHNKLTCFN
ncbi:MAG: hypothetical protein IJI25_01865 [Eubacterium sp.]|nr:hypothetical protein [Eubacterium sp.]